MASPLVPHYFLGGSYRPDRCAHCGLAESRPVHTRINVAAAKSAARVRSSVERVAAKFGGSKVVPSSSAAQNELEHKLFQIASNVLGFETMKTRCSDSLDFRDVSVWGVKDALEQAYRLGFAAAVEAGKKNAALLAAAEAAAAPAAPAAGRPIDRFQPGQMVNVSTETGRSLYVAEVLRRVTGSDGASFYTVKGRNGDAACFAEARLSEAS